MSLICFGLVTIIQKNFMSINYSYSMKAGNSHRNLEEEGAMCVEIASLFMHFLD